MNQNNQRALVVTCLLVALLPGLCPDVSVADPVRRPNIIFFLVDDKN